MKTLLNRAKFVKRSGTPLHEVVYCLVKAGSLGLFARESLPTVSTVYTVMNGEDLDWCRFHQEVALKAMRVMPASTGPKALGVG